MSYIKTVWQAGDTITAEKLNHLEGGVEEAANKPVFAPETVTGEGDISITYNGNQIGVLNDSGTLTLDTEGKVVEHDIEVEYTKAEAPDVPISYVLDLTEGQDAIEVTAPATAKGGDIIAVTMANTTGETITGIRIVCNLNIAETYTFYINVGSTMTRNIVVPTLPAGTDTFIVTIIDHK